MKDVVWGRRQNKNNSAPPIETEALMTSWKKEMIGRLRIWTNEKGISHVGHVPKGFGRMKLESEWEKIPLSKRPKYLVDNLYFRRVKYGLF